MRQGSEMSTINDLELTADERAALDREAVRLDDWVASEAGLNAIIEASRRSTEAADRRAESCQPDPSVFEQPMTC